MGINEILEELKEHCIEVVKDTSSSTFTCFRLIGPAFDSNKSWKWWQIREAYQSGRLCRQDDESMKKFDSRVKPGTKVLLAGYGRRGWGTVEAIHPNRKWIEVSGLLGSFQHKDVIKFSNNREAPGLGQVLNCLIKLN